MFEAPQCALKSNQPSVSGTNCNDEMSENASSLALNRRCVLLWWHRREVVSGPSQPQSSRGFADSSQSLQPVGSWCGILLVGVSAVACASQHLQNAVQKPHLHVSKTGLEGSLQKQRLLPSYQMCVCIKKNTNSTKGTAGLCF